MTLNLIVHRNVKVEPTDEDFDCMGRRLAEYVATTENDKYGGCQNQHGSGHIDRHFVRPIFPSEQIYASSVQWQHEK